jgi:transcriptional regulator with XRE-family HTH domain
MSFSSRLITLRKEQKIAQNELARRIGVHANVLGRYERDETTPSIEMAIKLANSLGVSVDYLVGKTDVKINQDILDKVTSIQLLPEEDRKCIMYSLNGLIQHAKTRQAYT